MKCPLVVPKPVNYQQIPAAMSTKVIECEECETEDAMWRCQQCEQSLCAMCDSSIHRKGARSRHIRDPLSAKALRAENLCATGGPQDDDGAPAPPAPVDGRIECKFCHRKFNPQRVEKHMRICNKATKECKKRKVYDGAKRRLEGTEFLQYQYNRSGTPELVKKWKKEGRKWREDSIRLRQGAGASPKKLDFDAEKRLVEKKMKFRLKGYGRGFEAKDEENGDTEVTTFAQQLAERKEQSQSETAQKRNFISDVFKDKKKKATSSGTKSTKSSAPSTGRRSARSTRSDRSDQSGISGISGVSARGSKKESVPKARSRPSSNTSTNSVNSASSRGSGRVSGRTSRTFKSKRTVDPKGLNVTGTETASTRVARKKKKPGVPRFGRNASTADLKMDSKPSKPVSRKPTFGAKRSVRAEPTKQRKTRSSDAVKPRVERMQRNNAQKPVEKLVQNVSMANAPRVPKEVQPVRRTTQPKVQKGQSAAKSLPRGIDLGVNVKQVQGNGPKGMDDYLERERMRRKDRANKTGMAGAAKAAYKSGAKKRKDSLSGVTKKMSQLELQEAKAKHEKAVQKVSKPSDSMASKRAAHFESLMQQPNE